MPTKSMPKTPRVPAGGQSKRDASPNQVSPSDIKRSVEKTIPKSKRGLEYLKDK